MSNRARNVLYAVLILITSFFIGIAGFYLVEGYGLLDAIYMTMLIVSTVGLGEVQPLSAKGKVFTSIYLLLNLGIFAYIVSVISQYMFEGEFRKVFATLIFNKRAKKLTNHIIVAGYGRTGARTCDELLKSKREFVLIEQNADVLTKLKENPQYQIIRDDATREEVLIDAGIEKCEALIVTLPSDTQNMLICITARGLNPSATIIARASEESAEKKLYRAGATRVVKPFAIGGIHMAHLITQPYVIEFLEILTGITKRDLALEEFAFESLREEYQNKTIRELDIRNKTGATVIGMRRQEKGFVFDPKSDTPIIPGDILIVIGSSESLRKFSRYCV